MQADYRKRIRRWFPWVAVMAALVLLAVPSMIRSQPNADGDKP